MNDTKDFAKTIAVMVFAGAFMFLSLGAVGDIKQALDRRHDALMRECTTSGASWMQCYGLVYQGKSVSNFMPATIYESN